MKNGGLHNNGKIRQVKEQQNCTGISERDQHDFVKGSSESGSV